MAAGPVGKEAAVRDMTRWMVGALTLSALVACGRTPFEPAPAPGEVLPMQPVQASGEAAIITLTDGGTDAYVDLNGTGFAPDRVYTGAVVDRLSGFPDVIAQGYVDLTAAGTPMQIRADGTTYYFGAFSIRDMSPSWDAIVVLWHPDGNPDRNGNEQVVLQTAIPDRFRP